MKFAIVGDGALGRFVGAHLIEDCNDVVFFTRPDKDVFEPQISYTVSRADAQIKIPKAQCLQQPGEAGLCDIVFVCVRRHQTEAAIAPLRHVLSHDTALISLQQGFDNFAALENKYDLPFVVGGACSYSLEKNADGGATQLGDEGKIVVGELNGESSWRLEIIEAALQSAGLDVSQSAHIKQEICLRAVFESAVGIFLAAGLSLRTDQETFVGLLNESINVLDAINFKIDSGFIEDAVRRFESLPDDFEPLVLRDLKNNRANEIDCLAGWIAGRGSDLGVATALHDRLLENLRMSD